MRRKQYTPASQRDWDNFKDWAPWAKVVLLVILAPLAVLGFISEKCHRLSKRFWRRAHLMQVNSLAYDSKPTER